MHTGREMMFDDFDVLRTDISKRGYMGPVRDEDVVRFFALISVRFRRFPIFFVRLICRWGWHIQSLGF